MAPSGIKSSARSTAFLCTDVIQSIIDHLNDDDVIQDSRDRRSMLINCSLVSRAWTHRSQTHLLRRIEIHSQVRLKSFVAAVATLSERVKRFIRFLRIRAPRKDESNYPESYSLTLEYLVVLLEALPRLDNLNLHGIQLNTAHGIPDRSDLRKPLKSLYLQDIRSSSLTYPPFKDIATLITFFPTINSLTLYFSHVCDTRGPAITDDISSIFQDVPGSFSTCIQKAYIYGGASLVQLLRSMPISDSLRRLEFHHHNTILKAIEDMLKDRSSRINTLKIQFTLEAEFSSYGFEQLVTWVDPDLVEADYHWTIVASDMPCLKSLELVYSLTWWNYKGALVVWNRMVKFLQYFSAMPLERLDIQFLVITAGPDAENEALEILRRLPWDELDRALQSYTTLNKPIALTLHAYVSRAEALQIMEIVVERLSSLELRSGQAGKSCRARLAWMRFGSEEIQDWEDVKTDAGERV